MNIASSTSAVASVDTSITGAANASQDKKFTCASTPGKELRNERDGKREYPGGKNCVMREMIRERITPGKSCEAKGNQSMNIVIL